MPAGPRIRQNNIFGNTTDNPLTAGAGTFNSPELANLQVVASAHAIVTLDPLREFGEPEIVIVTVHTAAATVATITRGAYGTVARSHPIGTLWVHAAVDEDFIEVLTSSTRPSDPYEGQFIYETDTNKLVGYGGVDWAPRDAGGQLGYAEVTAVQAGITAEVDLTGLTTTVTVGTGRRVKITGSILLQSTVAGDHGRMLIRTGGGTQLQFGDVEIATTAENYLIERSIVVTPAAGSNTYKLAGFRVSGTGSLTMAAAAGVPAFILVEDIGAA